VPAGNVTRLLEVYEAFGDGRLDLIPEFFEPEALYRSSGVFPGMAEVYRGHDGIAELWRASNEPWERFEIEALRTEAEDDWVAAEVRFTGRGAGSGVEVTIEVGHLVRFRRRRIVELAAFASWEQALAAVGRGLA